MLITCWYLCFVSLGSPYVALFGKSPLGLISFDFMISLLALCLCFLFRLVCFYADPLHNQPSLESAMPRAPRCSRSRQYTDALLTWLCSNSFIKFISQAASSVCQNKQTKHFYFNRLPRLWNSLPPIDLNQSHDTIMNSIKTHFWDYFMDNFDDNITCTFHFCCPCHTCNSSTRMNFNPNS